jgi:hypothetical protein
LALQPAALALILTIVMRGAIRQGVHEGALLRMRNAPECRTTPDDSGSDTPTPGILLLVLTANGNLGYTLPSGVRPWMKNAAPIESLVERTPRWRHLPSHLHLRFAILASVTNA